ncbi:MAG: double-strand break repair helicase AddA [Bauldia sp.]
MSVAAPTGVDRVTAAAQAEASHPANSAWVSANAGSGKTYVLARRVIRLLLAGTDPARILCLTFTKAAAAEMANRVFGILARWVTLSDADLAAAIAEIEGVAAGAALTAEARRLFAHALDTPGGLKVQTIHAFCDRLLHQFPFEANVAGHFEVLDQRGEKDLADEARRSVLARAAADPMGAIGQALDVVLAYSSDFGHEQAIGEFIDKRDRLRSWISGGDSLGKALADLRRALGLRADETVAGLRALVIGEAAIDRETAVRLADLLRSSGPSDAEAAARLAPYALSPDADQRIDAWLDFFMTGGNLRKSVVTNPVRAAWPGLDELLTAEGDRLDALLDRIQAAECFESTAAMLCLADAAVAEYERLKRARGLLDYEDLVVKTANLLSRSDARSWVHFKLDRGLDHILVDEGQDTSPRQWQVITALAEEFFTGQGASEVNRTLFAVGDEKQSIYSFQGAVPAWFSRIQREVGSSAKAAGYAWVDRELHLSFRSAPVVLSAVDRVFEAEAAHRGLSGELRAPVHTAWRRNAPGRVVVWPLVEPPKKRDTEDWATPVDHLGKDSPEVKLARRIADLIAGWLERGEVLEATGKPIPPGGILILTRTRGALTDAVNRALKSRGVPIAGADRLTLTDHIAVLDLVALGRVALLPQDDLSLAALLKSPLIGLTEDALYELAQARPGSLWEALAAKARERQDYAEAKGALDRWRALADYRDPHGFFAAILGPERGRRAFLKRLGPETEDVLDEFLAQALAYEATEAPSLEGFLYWLTASETEIKRDTDVARDEVRVMTVHGAKGLEADVVFLIDNGSMPVHPTHYPRVLALGDGSDPVAAVPYAWMRSSTVMPKVVSERLAEWCERAEEEYRRLLYVGLTRARDRLYVCGIAKKTGERARQRGWHALVERALEPECTRALSPSGDLEALEWRARPQVPGEGGRQPVGLAAIAIPDWAASNAPPAPPSARRLTPSTALAAEGGEPPDFPAPRLIAARGDTDAAQALARGRLIHRLLQSLPDIRPSDRDAAGARYLSALAGDRSPTDRAGLLAEVLAVIDHPEFAAVFAPGSRAEVEIAGRVQTAAGEATISGRVDRLAVTSDRVLIVDYKTNRPAPARLEEVPQDYLAQLALYRIVLTRLYPGRGVGGALLWTDRPALMAIPESVLEQAASTLVTGRP